ncbi:MAG: hypothetical protein EBV41_08045 [Actinobacteria bacterium]|nr:hypothetical protein [Actinomycetota bacterium]
MHVFDGALNANAHAAESGQMLVFSRAGGEVVLTTDRDAQALLLGGKPLGEPVVRYGPFVMNTREEIKQAIDDYQAGRLAVTS